MPIQINHGVKGKEYPPYAVTVERGKIKEFARAIGDESPFYMDDEVGRASPWGDIIAPPTFPVTFRNEKAGTKTLLHDLGVDIGRILLLTRLGSRRPAIVWSSVWSAGDVSQLSQLSRSFGDGARTEAAAGRDRVSRSGACSENDEPLPDPWLRRGHEVVAITA
jgi:hypothetical protein